MLFASEEERASRTFVLDAVRAGSAIDHAAETLKDDIEIIKAAVARSGFALKEASARLRDDSEVVTIAVQSRGLALEYASDELRSDQKVVLAAVEQNLHGLSMRARIRDSQRE